MSETERQCLCLYSTGEIMEGHVDICKFAADPVALHSCSAKPAEFRICFISS